MSVASSKKALKKAGMDASNIDLIVYAGILYDYLCPPSSVFVQEQLNIPYCAEISVHSNCTSIYKALQIASDMVANGRYNNALVVGAQISSAFLRADYFNQRVITEEQAVLRWFLSDGAGAVVLTSQKPEGTPLKVTDTYMESVGTGLDPAMRMLIGSERSILPQIYEKGWHHLVQDIKVVAKLAPDLFGRGIHEMLQKTRIDVSKVRCFFANIPTKHLMDLAVKNLKRDFQNPDLPFYTKLSTRGYQGAPAIIIALDDYLNETSLDPGDRLVSFVTESSKWMHAGFVLEAC
jgi:3-oxoacyl-[acyl-carrier-protein] synthase III